MILYQKEMLRLLPIEREKGGAWQPVQYAIKQEKDIINLYDESNI